MGAVHQVATAVRRGWDHRPHSGADAAPAESGTLADAAAGHLPADGVLLDIGAGTGQFTAALGTRTRFTGSAHLFEPSPRRAAQIARTLADAPYSVTVHHFGLSDTDTQARHRDGWVRMRRFDSVGLAVTPSLIRIDAAGAEYLVLEGMLAQLMAWSPQPVLIVRVDPRRHPNWAEEVVVLDELIGTGYRTATGTGDDVVVRDIMQPTDVFLLPESTYESLQAEHEATLDLTAMLDLTALELPAQTYRSSTARP